MPEGGHAGTRTADGGRAAVRGAAGDRVDPAASPRSRPLQASTGVLRPPVGFGLVGLGEIGQVHLRGLLRAPELVTVRAVADLDPQLRGAAAAASGAAACASTAELLAVEGVQAVGVCLPHHLHREVALAAIAAGRHVLLEKPMALTVAECDEINAAARRAGVRVGVSHNQLFYPPHARARQLLSCGALGRPLLLRMRLGIGGKFAGWRADPAATGGGLLFDAGVHRFYLARALFGEVERVTAMADASPRRGEELAVVVLRFRSGALGVIEANYRCAAGAFDDSIEICCSGATLYISGCEADFEGFRTGPALRRYDGAWHEEHVAPGGWEESVYASVRAFLRALVAGEAPPVDGAEGRAVVELIQRVYELTGASSESVVAV
jgi:predicted dehydrogenase